MSCYLRCAIRCIKFKIFLSVSTQYLCKKSCSVIVPMSNICKFIIYFINKCDEVINFAVFHGYFAIHVKTSLTYVLKSDKLLYS